MGLTKCVSCGEFYSDSLATCIHCGYTPHIFVCPECGSIYGTGNEICPSCGYEIAGTRKPATKEDEIRVLNDTRKKLESAGTDVQFKKILNTLNVLALQFDVREEIEKCVESLKEIAEQKRKDEIIKKAKETIEYNSDLKAVEQLIQELETCKGYEDADELIIYANNRLNSLKYDKAQTAMETAKTVEEWRNAQRLFESLASFHDSEEKAKKCEEHINALIVSKKRKSTMTICFSAGFLIIILTIASIIGYFIPNYHYNKGMSFFNDGRYIEALQEFRSAGDYKDASSQAETAQLAQYYYDGEKAFADEDYATAARCFSSARGYSDAVDRLAVSQLGIHYANGQDAFNRNDFSTAIDEYSKAKSFADSEQCLVESRYAHADQLFNNNSFKQAAFEFSNLCKLDYKDSKERAFDCAKALMNAEKFEDAAIAFDLVNDSQFHKYSLYALGKQALLKNDYMSAVSFFQQAYGVEDAKALCIDAAYEYAKQLMNKMDYSKAKTYFNIAKEKEDAETLSTACSLFLAEASYKRGYLNTAKAQYERLPLEFSYNGISVSERLSLFEKYKDFVSMCGKWKAKGDCQIESKQTYRLYGNWDNWTTTYSDPMKYLTITCVINNDGTVSVKGKAEMYRYTNYSILSAYLEGQDFSTSFDKRMYSIPNNTAMTNELTLSYNVSNQSIVAVNKVIDDQASIYFTYTYTSTYTYGTKIESY